MRLTVYACDLPVGVDDYGGVIVFTVRVLS
jgi:hypothetical protein